MYRRRLARQTRSTGAIPAIIIIIIIFVYLIDDKLDNQHPPRRARHNRNYRPTEGLSTAKPLLHTAHSG